MFSLTDATRAQELNDDTNCLLGLRPCERCFFPKVLFRILVFNVENEKRMNSRSFEFKFEMQGLS